MPRETLYTPPNTETHKLCKTCGEIKERTLFYYRATGDYSAKCKKCYVKRQDMLSRGFRGRVHIYLTKEERELAEGLAESRGQHLSKLIRQLIREAASGSQEGAA
jgi:hypothetical protein